MSQDAAIGCLNFLSTEPEDSIHKESEDCANYYWGNTCTTASEIGKWGNALSENWDLHEMEIDQCTYNQSSHNRYRQNILWEF